MTAYVCIAASNAVTPTSTDQRNSLVLWIGFIAMFFGAGAVAILAGWSGLKSKNISPGVSISYAAMMVTGGMAIAMGLLFTLLTVLIAVLSP